MAELSRGGRRYGAAGNGGGGGGGGGGGSPDAVVEVVVEGASMEDKTHNFQAIIFQILLLFIYLSLLQIYLSSIFPSKIKLNLEVIN